MIRFSGRIEKLKPSAIREILKYTADPNVISFAAGNPAPECFPVEKVGEITAEIFRDEPVAALQYAVSEGYTPLRDYIKSTLAGFDPELDDVVITSGGQQAAELTAKLFADEGDVIVCEEPSFIGVLNAFRSYGTALVGAATDERGFVLDTLEKTLAENSGNATRGNATRGNATGGNATGGNATGGNATGGKVAFIYTIPNFNNPTGRCSDVTRRRGLLALAQKYDVPVLEDNPYGELRFRGGDIPSLKQLAREEFPSVTVVYAGSFSKILAPGLRVGFMCADKAVTAKATAALQVSTVHTSILPQMIARRFLTRTDMSSSLSFLRGVYKRKCTLMTAELARVLPARVTFTRPDGGMFLWATVDGEVDMAGFCGELLKRNVAVVPGSAFMMDEAARSNCFRLNYSTPTDENIVIGIGRIGEVAREMFG